MAKKGKYIYDWPRPMVTVDAVVFAFSDNRPKLLLVNRKNPPFKGKWALPGGFVDIDEELEDAVARELAEETGLTNVTLEQMHTFGTIGRDPRGRQITIAFMGILTAPSCTTDKKGSPEKTLNKIKAGDDAAEARWFDIDKLPKDMAFDHNHVANFAIRKLKRKRIYQLNSKNKTRP